MALFVKSEIFTTTPKTTPDFALILVCYHFLSPAIMRQPLSLWFADGLQGHSHLFQASQVSLPDRFWIFS